MRRFWAGPRWLVSRVFCLFFLAPVLAGCGGGGGGGSSGGGGGGPASPDLGVLSSVSPSVELKLAHVDTGQFLTISGASQAAGADLTLGADSGAADVLWHAMPMSGGRFNIENLLTHQLMGIAAGSTQSGALALQWADNGTDDHLWNFYRLQNGNYLIRNVKSGLYLQVETAGAVDQAGRAATGTSQEWRIVDTGISPYPAPITVSGAGVDVHDPDLLQDSSGTFWLYGTHNTLATSSDLTNFARVSSGIITPDFPWWAALNTTGGGGRTDIWAPSILFANGTYYLYYAIPIFHPPNVAGANNGAQAAIGLATSANPNGPWTDKGEIISSCGNEAGCTTSFNAIDPAPFIDASGRWWLVFGSWEDGLHVLELDPATGLRHPTNMILYNIAARFAGLEGPFIFPHSVNGAQYYYYFASINPCCAGVSTTYRIVVGRSTSPTGPYFDRGGIDLMDGGGTILLSTHGDVIGPGGESVEIVNGQPTLVYHYYNGAANGAPRLGLNTLGFDADGWPVVQ
jgi:arabinan endo-1,5-alpha-L-arabinosidase